MKIYRSIAEPIIDMPRYKERIDGYDKGLINAWQVGRSLAMRDLDVAAKVKNGELPVLHVKGGVEKRVKVVKIGSLWYLAMWQGMRGEDLDIDMETEVEMICSRTGVKVLYTFDIVKLGNSL